MKLSLAIALLFFVANGFAQTALNLSNAVVISHLDKPEDRFSLEVTLSEILANVGVKNTVSLNLLKQGASTESLIRFLHLVQ
jgi:hypothetical protein